MDPAHTCATCGGLLTAGRCVRCENQWLYRFVHREIVILMVLAGATVGAFLLTRQFAISNEALRRQDGEAWYHLGEQALQRGDLDQGLAALGRAAAKEPDNPPYRLALAQALAAGGQIEAARQLLLALREQQPEDAETNLQLARLEIGDVDLTMVGRYYQTALVGLWKTEQRSEQRQVRTEFIEFLLGRGETDRALSELLVLEASLPNDAPSQLSAGRMLLEAGDPRRAADHFAKVLRSNPADQAALAGAGEAFFRLNDFTQARRYLDAVTEPSERIKDLRTVSRLVFDGDPLAPRLQPAERTQRLAAGLGQAIHRLETCETRGPSTQSNSGVEMEGLLAGLRGQAARLSGSRLATSDDIEDVVTLIARAERVSDRACASSDLTDQALLLIARRHGLGE